MTITITLDPGGPLKRDIIETAFDELAMSGYEFGRTAEEIVMALGRLDAMMAEWEADGILLGYDFPIAGPGDGSESSGIPLAAKNAVAAGLALRLAPPMGATLSAEAQRNCTAAVARLRSQYATIPTMPMGSKVPRGAGNRGLAPFITETVG